MENYTVQNIVSFLLNNKKKPSHPPTITNELCHAYCNPNLQCKSAQLACLNTAAGQATNHKEVPFLFSYRAVQFNKLVTMRMATTSFLCLAILVSLLGVGLAKVRNQNQRFDNNNCGRFLYGGFEPNGLHRYETNIARICQCYHGQITLPQSMIETDAQLFIPLTFMEPSLQVAVDRIYVGIELLMKPIHEAGRGGAQSLR